MDEEEAAKKNQDFLRELYLTGYDKAAAFMALIVSLGYAGMFTVWDRVQVYLTYCERMLVASLLSASLTLFVGWQIRGQWKMSQQQLAISNLVAAGVSDFPALIAQFRIDQAKVRVSLQRQLPYVFGVTVGLGALGSLILILACVRHVLSRHV